MSMDGSRNRYGGTILVMAIMGMDRVENGVIRT
jgi:hypothetical protein